MKSDKKYKISILLNQISHYKPFFYLAINNLKFFIKNIEGIKSWIETEIFKNKFNPICNIRKIQIQCVTISVTV